jgi:CHAT domain-containing protein
LNILEIAVMVLRSFRFWQTLFTISLIISLLLGQVSAIKAQPPNPNQFVQQGVTEYQQGQYQTAIALWHQALNNYQATPDNPNTVIVLENLARAYQQIGQVEQAIAFWTQVTKQYQNQGNKQQLGRSLTEQAQAYSKLGQHRQAIAILCDSLSNSECQAGSAIAIAQEQQDQLGEAAAKGSLGEAYRLRGNYQQAANYAQQSLTTAQLLDNHQLTMSALNSLGNTYSSLAQVSYRRAESAARRGETYGENSLLAKKTKTAQQQDQKALNYFQQSLELATTESNSLSQVRSIINSLPIYYRLQQYDRAATLKQQALSLISTLPPQQTTVYATIDLAKLLQPERATFNSCLNADNLRQAQELLKPAVILATRLGEKRAGSFAFGELGHTYECVGNYQQALDLTQQARLAAEKDKDSLYLWEWQTGRILRNQGNKEQSIDAYETAIATLESIRDELLTANRDLQFDFRDTVEPIYRELIEQRLEAGDNTIVIKANQTAQVENVSSVLNTVDSLRLAELQNYFGNDCAISDVIPAAKVDLLQPDKHTAYFSSILLKDRIAIIANFPDRQTKIAWHDSGTTAITQEINEFRRGLEAFYDDDYNSQPGQNIYNWLIKPFAQDLQREKIDTLVFVQDGILKSIPMAALHDGKQFLVEKYAIATTPSLNLIARSRLDSKLKALALGLTKESTIDGRVYNPLPNVKQEIKQVQNIFADSTGLLDKTFTRDRLQQELAKTSYPIVHIATHGQFSDEPEDTFLITGDGKKLTITELDRLIRTTAQDNQPVNLISLTACQTAVGDERAALGLAGVAIQAGASSALASLWSISDEITPEVVKEFYTSLQQGNTTKAKALQQAQKSLIAKGEHPAFWSPFIIIGDWL